MVLIAIVTGLKISAQNEKKRVSLAFLTNGCVSAKNQTLG